MDKIIEKILEEKWKKMWIKNLSNCFEWEKKMIILMLN